MRLMRGEDSPEGGGVCGEVWMLKGDKRDREREGERENDFRSRG